MKRSFEHPSKVSRSKDKYSTHTGTHRDFGLGLDHLAGTGEERQLLDNLRRWQAIHLNHQGRNGDPPWTLGDAAACGGAAGAAGARDGCILFRCASCLSNRARARYHMYCRGTVFLSSCRCCGAMRSGAERGRRGDGDGAVTRNKGGVSASLSFY